jgi:hypothetical protein
VLVSDAFDLAVEGALPVRAPREPSAAATVTAPSLTRPSPLTVSPRLKTVLPSFRATQSCCLAATLVVRCL